MQNAADKAAFFSESVRFKFMANKVVNILKKSKKMLAILRGYVKNSPKSQWCGFITIHTQIGGKLS